MKKTALYLTLLSLLLLPAGCGPAAFRVELISAKQNLVETTILKDRGLFIRDKIAVINVDGFIANRQKQGLIRSGENPVSTFLEKLNKAASDSRVKAVVLRINSPGGTVAASDLMYHSLMQFKTSTHIPVVASILDVGASGGYYVACGADGIVAQPTCVTGSIGTIMQTVSLQGTLGKLGMKTVAIKSGKMKDMASPLHDLTDSERELLQGIIDNFFETFFAVVHRARTNIPEEKLRKLADGRVFTAKDALANGLIDQIGYPDDAIAWAKQLAHIDKAKVVVYHRRDSYMPNIYGSADSSVGHAGALVNVEIPDWLESPGTTFLYLWQPGLNE